MIALITTSPYPEFESVKDVTVPSLVSQTCQDFTWYYLDGFYSYNQQYFRELQDSVEFKIVHSPLLHATHYPHEFTWEAYNSAVLLSQEPLFLRFGRFRNYHPKTVEFILSNLITGMVFNLPFSHIYEPLDFNQIHTFQTGPGSNGGMIAMARDEFIHLLNGNDEVGLHWNHFEDVELSHRIWNNGLKYIDYRPLITRYPHDAVRQNHLFDEPIPCIPDNDKLLRYILKLREISPQYHSDFELFIYNGFEWFYNKKYNILDPSDPNKYAIYTQKSIRAIIGIHGLRIGRNLPKIDMGLQPIHNINERIQFIHDCWDNQEIFRE